MNKSMTMLLVAAVSLVGSSAQAAVVYSEDFNSATVGNTLEQAPTLWDHSCCGIVEIADSDPLRVGGGNYAAGGAGGFGRDWKRGLSAAISAETFGIRFTALEGVQDTSGAAVGDTSDTGLVAVGSINTRRAKFQYHQDAIGGWQLLYTNSGGNSTTASFGGVFAGGSNADDTERFEFKLQASLVPGVGITASVTPVGGSATSIFIADADLQAGWYDDIDAVRIAGGGNSPIAVDDIHIATVPEPATLAMLVLGTIALSSRRRR